MIDIKIKYQNVEYKTLSDALKKVIDDRIKLIYQKIKPFEGEIKKAGGKVTIQVLKDAKINIKLDDVPEGLSKKIRSAVQQL